MSQATKQIFEIMVKDLTTGEAVASNVVLSDRDRLCIDDIREKQGSEHATACILDLHLLRMHSGGRGPSA